VAVSAYTTALRGRAKAEADMVDACIVQHLTGSSTDQETGVVTPTYATVYSGTGPGGGGKCKVQQTAPAGSPTDVGEAAVYVGQLQLHLPVTAVTALVAPDDLVTMTVCVLDASLVGRTFRLRGPAHKSYATARRFPMIETSG
jgi:hypothetical protein